MGLDPAPLFVNLFLFRYESEWRVKMKNVDHYRTRKFRYIYKFVDGLIDENKEFENSFIDLNPNEAGSDLANLI